MLIAWVALYKEITMKSILNACGLMSSLNVRQLNRPLPGPTSKEPSCLVFANDQASTSNSTDCAQNDLVSNTLQMLPLSEFLTWSFSEGLSSHQRILNQCLICPGSLPWRFQAAVGPLYLLVLMYDPRMYIEQRPTWNFPPDPSSLHSWQFAPTSLSIPK